MNKYDRLPARRPRSFVIGEAFCSLQEIPRRGFSCVIVDWRRLQIGTVVPVTEPRRSTKRYRQCDREEANQHWLVIAKSKTANGNTFSEGLGARPFDR